MSLYQVYAFVTESDWDNFSSKRFPDAISVKDYRLLVFTNLDLPTLKKEYENIDFKNLTIEKTINAINANEAGPFLCDFQAAEEITNHFIKLSEEEPIP